MCSFAGVRRECLMTKVKGSLIWLEPLRLRHEQGLTTEKRIVKALRDQLLAALVKQDFGKADLDRCVYIIRMTGDFVISYPAGMSPVLYIGRGDAFTRLSSHLKRWLNQVDGFGKDVGIEVRVCRPRRKGSRTCSSTSRRTSSQTSRRDTAASHFLTAGARPRTRGASITLTVT
jgi:hypothetical protein